MRFRLTAEAPGRARLFNVALDQNRLTAAFRVHHGDLATLEGPPRPLPDRLRVRMDLSTKSGLFRVGVEDLEAAAALTVTPEERTIALAFQQEPHWLLPLLVHPFLRSSLRRPFQAGGARLAYALHAGEEQTTITREYSLVVKESWIVRWLGGFVGGAVSDFRRSAEAESDRFTSEGLAALRDDVVEIVLSPRS